LNNSSPPRPAGALFSRNKRGSKANKAKINKMIKSSRIGRAMSQAQMLCVNEVSERMVIESSPVENELFNGIFAALADHTSNLKIG
jgi:hypothetical protein